MTRSSSRGVAALSAIAAGAALSIALASEYFGGLVPCPLCLLERWPYRIAIGLGVLAAIAPARWRNGLLWLLVLSLLGAALLAFVHVGVEQGFWPSPLPECQAPTFAAGSIAQRLASMPATPSKPCDEPTYLVPFIPVSMAAMNLLFALCFAAMLSIYLSQPRRRRR